MEDDVPYGAIGSTPGQQHSCICGCGSIPKDKDDHIQLRCVIGFCDVAYIIPVGSRGQLEEQKR